MDTDYRLIGAGLLVAALILTMTTPVAATATVGASAPADVATATVDLPVATGGAVLAATDDVTTDCHIWLVDGPECRHEEETV